MAYMTSSQHARQMLALLSVATAALLLDACGGSGSSGTDGGGGTPYTVGGTLTGLANGATLVLQDNGSDNLTLSQNGSFTFATTVASGGAYSATVLTQPAGQSCTISGGSGMASANITTIAVACANITYTIGGTLSGLASGTTVVLQDNGSDNLTLSQNGSFTFATAVASGGAYSATVLTQPTGQSCSVTGGSGMASANVTTIAVACNNSAGSGLTNAALDGTYYGLVYGTTTNSGGVWQSVALNGAADGQGQWTSTPVESNTNGTVSSTPGTSTSQSYSITAQGGLTVSPAPGSNAGEPEGGILGTAGHVGDAFVMVDVRPNDLPGLVVGVKAASNATLLSQIAGPYAAVTLSVGTSSETVDLETGTLTVDTGGSTITASSASVVQNISGSITTHSTAGYDSNTYSLSSSGVLTQTVSGSSYSIGYVSADDDFVILQNTSSGHDPAVTFVVRQGAGVTPATLSGTYTIAAFTGSNGGGANSAEGAEGAVMFPGDGTYKTNGTLTDNASGSIMAASMAGTYTIDGNGNLVLTDVSGTVHTGAVSGDGDVFVLADVTNGEIPNIIIGVRSQ